MVRTRRNPLSLVLFLAASLVFLPGCPSREPGSQPAVNDDGTVNPDGVMDLAEDQNFVDVLIDCALDGERDEDCDQREENSSFWAKVLQHADEEVITPGFREPITEPVAEAEKSLLCLTVGWFCPDVDEAEDPDETSSLPSTEDLNLVATDPAAGDVFGPTPR